MAKTFPLTVADFFGQLPITTFSPDLTEAMDVSRTRGGEVITADNGPRLWVSKITLRGGSYDEQERFRAMVNQLRMPGRSLLVPAMPRSAPLNDPKGLLLVGHTPKLFYVAGNNRDVTISGLPVGYKLTYGDCISFQYGSNPVRYAMHQIVSEGTANLEGKLVVEVVDFIRPGYSIDSNVQLINPYFKAVLVPGSASMGTTGSQQTSGIEFQVIQTFR